MNVKISKMKKFRDKIENYIVDAERKWKVLPEDRQRLFTKLFFAGYAALTVAVIISICISTGNNTNTMQIKHISTISKQTAVKKVANDNRSSFPIKK